MKEGTHRRLIIHATNVHQGGGSSLLGALLSALPGDIGLIALLDSRMKVPDGLPVRLQIRRIKPTIVKRWGAEWWLSGNVQREDVVLCFGNLPPWFKLRGCTRVFLQNRYLIERVSLSGFSVGIRWRIRAERMWFSLKSGHADEFIVQTPSMKAALVSRLANGVPVHILPFVGRAKGYSRETAQHEHENSRRYDFLYVASGEAHKNHRRLIDAWCLLAQEGLFPSLCLTVSESDAPSLCRWMNEKKEHYGLQLENVGLLPQDKIQQLYGEVRALIYPSIFESFGLPLIEARQAGLAVLAAEMDYVRDLLDPEESFDPYSSLSIVRAVKRFMGSDEQPLTLLDAADFMKRIAGNIA